MATRKKKTRKVTRRSGSGGSGGSGRGNPRNSDRTTEQQHDEAVNVLRAEYYQSVRGIAQELADRTNGKNKDIENQDDWETEIHQAVDGSYWVIYTHANFQVLMCSDNHNAYSEEFGEPPVSGDSINWAALAFAAMDRDVREQISAEGIEPNWGEAPEGELEEHQHQPRYPAPPMSKPVWRGRGYSIYVRPNGRFDVYKDPNEYYSSFSTLRQAKDAILGSVPQRRPARRSR